MFVSGRTNLKRNKDKHILIKRKNLNQIVENPARASLKNWLAALSRAKSSGNAAIVSLFLPRMSAALNFL